MKGHVIKKRCLRYRIESLVLIIFVVIAQVSFRPRITRAEGVVSLAEYVLTLFASMGVGISNEGVLNAMSTYMNIDINSGTESIRDSISQCENAMGSNLISSTFASNQQSTEEYLEIVGNDSLDGYPDYTATASENISASIDNYNNYGFVSTVEGGSKLSSGLSLMSLAKIAGEAASSAWGKFQNFVANKILGGLGLLEIDYAGGRNQGVGAYRWDSYNTSYSPYYFATLNVNGVLVGHYEDSKGPYIWIVNNSSSNIRLNSYYFRVNGTPPATGTIVVGGYYKMYSYGVGPNGKSVWGGIEGDPENYVGVGMPEMHSPDIIGSDGNLTPGKKPTFSHNSDKPYLVPIPMNVYLIWAGEARENTENGDTGDNQGNDFNMLLTPFFHGQVDADGIPQGSLTDPHPVYPAQPTYVPYPTSDPLASPTPATEVVPAPTLTPQELGQELEGKTIRNLGNVFPFCIPFDIVSLFKKMVVPRKAPVITWETNFGQFGSAGTVTIDFAMFDGAAAVCRTFELILFILGLMIATKHLIGWGG